MSSLERNPDHPKTGQMSIKERNPDQPDAGRPDEQPEAKSRSDRHRLDKPTPEPPPAGTTRCGQRGEEDDELLCLDTVDALSLVGI
jgi:hypothetical protein